MYDTEDGAIFHPLKEINTVIKQLLFPVVLKACSTTSVCVSAFKIRSTLRTFSGRFSVFPHYSLCFARFYHQLIKCKVFLSYSFGSYFYTSGGERGISAPPGLRQRSRFVGLLISRCACEDKGGSICTECEGSKQGSWKLDVFISNGGNILGTSG